MTNPTFILEGTRLPDGHVEWRVTHEGEPSYDELIGAASSLLVMLLTTQDDHEMHPTEVLAWLLAKACTSMDTARIYPKGTLSKKSYDA